LALELLRPQWAAPAGVGAAMSQRAGGVSSGPFESLNLSFGVGDDAAAVAENRRRWAAALGVQPVWMRQVHGVDVMRLTAEHRTRAEGAPLPTADAAWTTERGLACTVGAADCMPVLFALRDGSAVAAAHAGWRGLAGGVLEATLAALCQGTGARPADVCVWLGPCIGPRRFEVGAEVLAAFGHDPAAEPAEASPAGPRFLPHRRADGSAAWLANLPRLALDRLGAAGVTEISDAAACTVEDASRFFSFRRDRVTGRMAAAIWRA
jgi:YfiH family protein